MFVTAQSGSGKADDDTLYCFHCKNGSRGGVIFAETGKDVGEALHPPTRKKGWVSRLEE